MPISDQMVELMGKQSWIRVMFEEGLKLKEKYGAENVYDFSLGNPDLPPPAEYLEALKELAADINTPHGYMPNPGWPQVRESVAGFVSEEQEVKLTGEHIVMGTGAAGVLNCLCKVLLNPGDEVMTPSPYFSEYGAYVSNHGGALAPVDSKDDFQLDLDAMEKAVNQHTRMVIINSPHNPTGVVYPAEDLKKLGDILEKKSAEFKKRIYLVSDEPYRKIIFDGLSVPSVFKAYDHTIVVSSYSKDLSLAGERIGFGAVNPASEDADLILKGMGVATRILGFVNAPSLSQLAVGRLQGISVDVARYEKRKNMLTKALIEAGYEFAKPQGAFYIFPKTPTKDDVAFAMALKDQRIIVVPGSGFGRAGHFRISYAVPEATIEASLPGFAKALKEFQA
jgi:aspartate aminotransferase